MYDAQALASFLTSILWNSHCIEYQLFFIDAVEMLLDALAKESRDRSHPAAVGENELAADLASIRHPIYEKLCVLHTSPYFSSCANYKDTFSNQIVLFLKLNHLALATAPDVAGMSMKFTASAYFGMYVSMKLEHVSTSLVIRVFTAATGWVKVPPNPCWLRCMLM